MLGGAQTLALKNMTNDLQHHGSLPESMGRTELGTAEAFWSVLNHVNTIPSPDM